MATIAEALGGNSLNIAEAIEEFSPGGGSSSPLIVTMSRTADSNIDKSVPFICDTSIDDIDAALQAGIPVLANVKHFNTGSTTSPTCIWTTRISFVMGQYLGLMDTWAYDNMQSYGISHPPKSSDDKFGSWSLVAVPFEE